MITQVLDRQLYPESIDKPSLYHIINQANIFAACSLPHLKHTFEFARRCAQSSLFQIVYIIVGGMGVWVLLVWAAFEPIPYSQLFSEGSSHAVAKKWGFM